MSTRTSAADRNYLSLSRNIVQYAAGTDHSYQGDIPNPPIIMPDNPQDWDAILKVADYSHDQSFFGLKVAQGMENAIDCNAGAHHLIFDGEIGFGGGRGDQTITVKGGCHHIRVDGMLWSQGRIADCVLGTWSDQSFDTSYALDFSDLKRVNGQPVTFVFGRVNSPIRALFGKSPDIKLPPHAKILFWRSLGTQIYWWSKWMLIKVKIIK